MLVVILAGCSRAGPFVTHVAQLPTGAIKVRKCTVVVSPWIIANIKIDECSTETLPVVNSPEEWKAAIDK